MDASGRNLRTVQAHLDCVDPDQMLVWTWLQSLKRHKKFRTVVRQAVMLIFEFTFLGTYNLLKDWYGDIYEAIIEEGRERERQNLAALTQQLQQERQALNDVRLELQAMIAGQFVATLPTAPALPPLDLERFDNNVDIDADTADVLLDSMFDF